MAGHKFKAHDRRLLQTLADVCKAIQARDARTANPKKTRTLSTRDRMWAQIVDGPINIHPLNAIETAARSKLILPAS